MPWYLFNRKDTGDLVSEGDAIPAGLDTTIYETQQLVDRPDWTVKAWNSTTKTLYDRPIPILIDRLDDIQARFLADPDFSAVWATLNATRRTQLKTGIMRILASILRDRRWRQENEDAEI
jgi:hypothetical protein